MSRKSIYFHWFLNARYCNMKLVASMDCSLQLWKETTEINLSSPFEMGSFIFFLNYILSPKRKQTFSIEAKQLQVCVFLRDEHYIKLLIMLISRGLNFSVAQKRVTFACSFKVSSGFFLLLELCEAVGAWKRKYVPLNIFLSTVNEISQHHFNSTLRDIPDAHLNSNPSHFIVIAFRAQGLVNTGTEKKSSVLKNTFHWNQRKTYVPTATFSI